MASFNEVVEEAEMMGFDGIIGFEEAKMVPLDLLQTQKLISTPNPKTTEFAEKVKYGKQILEISSQS